MCNSVRDDRVGHAYLFSGPRGTGKTSTARILAKAINCENPSDGEPCGECESCLAFAAGTSYDLHELDAASNNKVEDIRDLISKVSFGTPGRRKVYVLDEVHMLTTGAENALLKTLEEPPAHVCFVMCTTEPHKVAATVRSRAQHLLFELVTAEELAEHVRWVAEDAELSLSEDDLDYAVRAGNGSVRDTLSALDQVVSAEGKPDDDDLIEEFVAALAAHDTGKMLAAADGAIRSGKEPRVIGEEIVGALRSAFLCSVGADLSHLLPQEQAQAQARAAQLPTAAITKTFEELGQALVHMRQSPDPRIDLELAFFRIGGGAGDAPAGGKATGGASGQARDRRQDADTAKPEIPQRNRSLQDSEKEVQKPQVPASRKDSGNKLQENKPQEDENQGIPESASEDFGSSRVDESSTSASTAHGLKASEDFGSREFDETPAAEHQPSSEHPPPPMPRDPSRAERARAEIREQLRSAAPNSRTNRGGGAQTTSVPEVSASHAGAAEGNPGATSATGSSGTGAPTLGAIRRRRAAERSETAPQSGQPARQAEAAYSNEAQEEPESYPAMQTAYPESRTAYAESQAAHPEPSQASTSPASQPHSSTSTASHSNPRKSTAEAVGISEETMALVEEYFPDARAVELPESVGQMTSPDIEQAGYQQPVEVSSGQISSGGRDDAKQASAQQPSEAASASADSTQYNAQPNSTDSMTESAESIPAGPLPSRDEMTVAWGNEIFDSLSPPLKRRFSVARFLESQDDAVRLAMPAAAVSSITAEQYQEVETRLAEHFGYRVAVLLAEDDCSTPAPPDPEMLISRDVSDVPLDTPTDKIFTDGTETSNETSATSGSTSRVESTNGAATADETDSVEDRLRKAISHDAAMSIEAEALEAPQEVNPNIPQDSLFG